MGFLFYNRTNKLIFRYYSMIVVNTEDTTHVINIIPRYSTFASVSMDLYNEETQVSETIDNTNSLLDGYLTITFDYTFTEGSKYQVKLYEGNDIIYRGKLMATTQNTQTFKSDNGLYYY